MRFFVLFAFCLAMLACPAPDPGNGGGNSDAGSAGLDAGACQAWDETEMPAVAETMGVFDELRRRIVFFGGDDVLPVNCQNAGHAVGR